MGDKKFSIIGGDLRSVKLAELIAAEGKSVNIYGFSNAGFEIKLKQSNTISDAINDTDVVIGPIPFSNDNVFINAPFHTDKIYINEVFKCINKNQLFIAGRISEKISHMAQVYNVYTVDLLEREEMAVLNAIPTAEGAIQIALEEMPTTLHNSNALILGFGRIGKTLAKVLTGMGANVYVEARKYSDLAWIRNYGYKPVLLSELANTVKSINVLFNTIPSIILNNEILKALNPNCLIIDLASKPGGVDFEKAKELGLKAIWALSLPGKVAPVTAAEFIKDTAYNIIEELGV
ncbi:dipicolinate synthase subunit DpsA [Ruminiclostridium herbifermentans]|uniref:Dipicolinate synthase subunit DpsA n=1 Tax=Ruminiclostridium herbifermentans TaxID=2488810 RepID=A0A4U7JIN1_9FIRM|nr:dipicolinate synthase subunit DpsA [Ruminiclostridium herbifermentans]QNU65298.1 dipicolinate synthase subunit DpsA [Ruminiclostridium herbifermentans]